MRLGVDASNLRLGGGITHLVELLRAAEPAKFGFGEVVVWGRRATLDRIEERPWLSKVDQPFLRRGIFAQTYWQRFRLSDLARNAGCDVLFVPGGSYIGSFNPVVTMSRNMLPFEWRETRRYGWSASTLKFILLRLVQTRTLRKAHGVIFLSQYAREAVLKAIGGLQGKAVLVPHGVSPRFFAAPRPQRRYAEFNPASPCRVLYVSTTEPYKHQWQVAEAIADLRSDGVPITIDFVGPPGAGHRRLTDAIRRLDPNGSFIKYRGEMPYEALHQLYASVDIGVFASSCENMPNILLEGMACGLPMACSKMGPMPELLAEAGVYFDPERREEIAAAVSSLMLSAELRGANARAALARAQQYSWKRCADDTFAFLAEIAQIPCQAGTGEPGSIPEISE